MSEPIFPAVAALSVRQYDRAVILDALREGARLLGFAPYRFAGKKVVLKPNLVAAMAPENAATTHPAFLAAAVDFLREYGATDLRLAESPGGIYSEAALRRIYKACGILDVAEELSLPLNYGTDAVNVSAPVAQTCRSFHILRPIAEADVIVDLCRLKSHSLTRYSGAVKNFFGVIPGVEKFEMHSAYPTVPVFAKMVVDLGQMLCDAHEVLALGDGIVAMEGNGPTGGTPREIGAVLMSESPFALDAAAEEILGFAGTVVIAEEARRRGLCPAVGQTEIRGTPLSAFAVPDFREPDTSGGKLGSRILRSLPTLFGGRLASFFSPRPQIDRQKCVGCGVCVQSCPRHTIEIRQTKRGKQAVIDDGGCIRCYCCQELCPLHAVNIKQNPLITLLH